MSIKAKEQSPGKDNYEYEKKVYVVLDNIFVNFLHDNCFALQLLLHLFLIYRFQLVLYHFIPRKLKSLWYLKVVN